MKGPTLNSKYIIFPPVNVYAHLVCIQHSYESFHFDRNTVLQKTAANILTFKIKHWVVDYLSDATAGEKLDVAYVAL